MNSGLLKKLAIFLLLYFSCNLLVLISIGVLSVGMTDAEVFTKYGIWIATSYIGAVVSLVAVGILSTTGE